MVMSFFWEDMDLDMDMEDLPIMVMSMDIHTLDNINFLDMDGVIII